MAVGFRMEGEAVGYCWGRWGSGVSARPVRQGESFQGIEVFYKTILTYIS